MDSKKDLLSINEANFIPVTQHYCWQNIIQKIGHYFIKYQFSKTLPTQKGTFWYTIDSQMLNKLTKKDCRSEEKNAITKNY